jgi:hypothetical protein
MTKIYLCYRHDDAYRDVGRICDHLYKKFGEENIVRDIHKTVSRDKFQAFMKLAVAECQVMLVLIGQHWLDVDPRTGQRYIDNPNDAIRLEITQGLSQNLIVIPVILTGASLPTSQDLPTPIQSIVYRNAALVRIDPDFNRDIERLIAGIRQEIGSAYPSIWQIAVLLVFALVVCSGIYSFFWLKGLAPGFFIAQNPTPTLTPTTPPPTFTPQSSRTPLPTLPPQRTLINIQGMPPFVSSVTDWISSNGNLPCNGIQNTNLEAASFGRVITPVGVKLRDEPSLQARQIGGIAENEIFVALTGPVCHQDYEWWLVNHYGAVGWITGADTQEYWLELTSTLLNTSYEWSRNAAYVAFEGGYMFWFDGFRQIFVLFTDNSTWNVYLDEWRETDAGFDPLIVPPTGFYQPTRGFGFVWRNQSDVRSRLNWSLAPETGYTTTIAYNFQHDMNNLATYTRLSGYRQFTTPTGQTFTLHDNGQWN